MFLNLQWINPMGHIAYLADYKKSILQKHENVANYLKVKHKQIQGIHPMVICVPWAYSFIHNLKINKT